MEGFFYFFSAGFPFTAGAFLPGLWLALALDCLWGDPRRLPHPVMLIGGLAKACESVFRENFFLQNRHISLRRAGQLTVATTLVSVSACIILFFFLFWLVSPLLLFAGSVLLLYTTIALRSLVEHALAVYHALPDDKETITDAMLDPARQKVGLIVGRDTTRLSYQGIVRACVESVAENMSDGVIAPVFYAIVGAAFSVVCGMGRWAVPAAAFMAMLYKTVNTMDSMFGYKNARYLQFGRAAARLDDLVNFIPARLTSFALVAVSFFIGKQKATQAWKILLRDHHKHSSPNAGWPEAAMAGSLAIQLGGPGCYFDEIVEKPFIGNDGESPRRQHIKTGLVLMCAGSFLFFVVGSICYSFLL